MYCRKCGIENSDAAKFCSGCGSPLRAGAVAMKEVVVEKYLFMKSVLRLLSQGNFFRKAFAVVLRVLAVVIIIASLVGWISVWSLVSRASFEVILGIVIFQLLFVIAIYMVAHTLFIRARDIAELPDADFTVIPIVSISLKLIGEVYACFATVISVAGGILIWFIGGNALYLLKESAPLVPGFGAGGGFLGGLLCMGGGLLVAFLVLVFFYFLAEAVVVMVDIAKNIKITRQIAEQQGRGKKSSLR
jgi:zinc-ribbon domain